MWFTSGDNKISNEGCARNTKIHTLIIKGRKK